MLRRAITYLLAGLFGLSILPVWSLAASTDPSVAAGGDPSALSNSANTDDLQTQIDAHNAQISQLDQEIAQYQTQLNAVSQKSQTLQGQVSQINLLIKKTTAQVSVTQNQISATQLQIKQLSKGIASKQASISDEQAGISQSLRRLSIADSIPLVIAALSSENISTLWEDINAIENFNAALDQDIGRLSADKQSLTNSKTAAETKQAQLLKQQQTLKTQQGSLAAQKSSLNDLLAQTKSQQSAYESLISQKKAQQLSLQQALTDLQSQYNVAVNPNSYPPTTPGLFSWPIDGKITITQYFGDTPFSQAHASLYSGHGHDGLDIAAPIGTPVHAALSGIIIGTGNTDAVKGCYSFGKWVMIQHNDGLNTMYAHLSQIGVTKGQRVTTGDVIGYSGETGYATGPHLHFGVYVSSVTQIIPLGQATKSKTPCSTAVMPVPPVSGYLNPLNYLPTL